MTTLLAQTRREVTVADATKATLETEHNAHVSIMYCIGNILNMFVLSKLCFNVNDILFGQSTNESDHSIKNIKI